MKELTREEFKIQEKRLDKFLSWYQGKLKSSIYINETLWLRLFYRVRDKAEV